MHISKAFYAIDFDYKGLWLLKMMIFSICTWIYKSSKNTSWLSSNHIGMIKWTWFKSFDLTKYKIQRISYEQCDDLP